jgi:hypothetical protein
LPVSPEKDLSKKRGREAAAEVRKKIQEKLDEQKKHLDRKLLARYTDIESNLKFVNSYNDILQMSS